MNMDVSYQEVQEKMQVKMSTEYSEYVVRLCFQGNITINFTKWENRS